MSSMLGDRSGNRGRCAQPCRQSYKLINKTTGKDQKVEIKDKIPEYTTYVDGSASDGGVYKDGEYVSEYWEGIINEKQYQSIY